MKAKAIYRYAQISPQKARLVAALIKGKPVNDALQILRGTRKRAAYVIDKVLRSALANAEETAGGNLDALVVQETRVNCGPMHKWHWARPRGMGAPMVSRTSHITVVVSDEGKR
ncbi:MAG: 50S ribosomal protein L22 [Planctomycetes bacterium RIFCSPHIGHO2_02_FULL_50_42]|nr:MAG: 50S ribosomal protein L22 [Planctomycetes bacterium GWA2_50_13]OHB89879.1 MAG: 50S ribosomal protein L22 [Planctomycetes bacterium RIFCSPHIGHO2_02_FULL_50_42]OHB91412.1 MAG: 50S ribosomal protein L22 [Planctomycetes bacterium RIFCSPHIGHO2_12_FULL_51_37]OHB95526.1 MAG: 50S ribosomal protein L22 [Planctomycetes bacterium RIFCSPLOWO2_02_FULL_50_16]OHC05175.1 MAG: 50S ribosomal protein L22 [Planctomycetes bacterium RIFCSPLOWO2_12_FULL_50_35]HCN19967.1 50S ribosomal protein L22 [Planctomyce